VAIVTYGAGLDNLKELAEILVNRIYHQGENTPTHAFWEYHKDKGWDYREFQPDITVNYYGQDLSFDRYKEPYSGTVTSAVVKNAEGTIFLEVSGIDIPFNKVDGFPDTQLLLNGADTITGTDRAQVMESWSGDDLMSGLGGHDILVGGAHDDTLNGGDGNDQLFGDEIDELDGLFIKNGDDTLNGDRGNDELHGGGGADKLSGGSNNDELHGDDGKDALNGGTGNDWLDGGEDNDTLLGAAGQDTLNGGDNRDMLIGGKGKDTLYGGYDADQFIFIKKTDTTTKAAGRDIIEDFRRLEKDRINVADMDADTKRHGDQDFTFIGKHAFNDIAGELRFEKKGGDTFVYGDINGDGKADFAIQIDDSINLIKHDFIL
jgi:Ca2+-binding RTX toxin-like protein